MDSGTGSAQSIESMFHMIDFSPASLSSCSPSALRAPYGKRNNGARLPSTSLSRVSVDSTCSRRASPVVRDSWAWVRLWLPTA
ncbi:hypothetical protein D3C81_2109070 [compost metagenome]